MEVFSKHRWTWAAICIAVIMSTVSAEETNAEASTDLSMLSSMEYYLSIEIINRIYNDSLLDPESFDYKTLHREVNKTLNEIYGCTTCSTKDDYQGVQEITFSHGSVIANSTITFKGVMTNTAVVRSLFYFALIQTPIIEGLEINPNSIMDSYIMEKPPTTSSTTSTPPTTMTTTQTTTPTTTTTITTTTTPAATTTTTATITTTTTPPDTTTTPPAAPITTEPTTSTTTEPTTSTTTEPTTSTTTEPTTSTTTERTTSTTTEPTTSTTTERTTSTTTEPTTSTTTEPTTSTTTEPTTSTTTEPTTSTTTEPTTMSATTTTTTMSTSTTTAKRTLKTAATTTHNSTSQADRRNTSSFNSSGHTTHTKEATPFFNNTTVNKTEPVPITSQPLSHNDDGVPGWAIALLVLAAIAILLLLIIIAILLIRWCCVDDGRDDVRSLPPQEHTPYMRTTFREPLSSVPPYSPHTPQKNLYPFDDLAQSPKPKPTRTGTYTVNPEK